MDFRTAPQPSELTWVGPRGFGKTKTAGATYGGRKLLIQTPICATRMFKDPQSMTLYLSLTDDIQKQFGDFVQSYETYAAGLPHAADIELSSCLRNGSFRLTVWNDAQWFDASGVYLKEPPSAIHSCAAILEFQGCWVSGTKWGLKWKATQIKMGVVAGEHTQHTQHTQAKIQEVKAVKQCMLIDD